MLNLDQTNCSFTVEFGGHMKRLSLVAFGLWSIVVVCSLANLGAQKVPYRQDLFLMTEDPDTDWNLHGKNILLIGFPTRTELVMKYETRVIISPTPDAQNVEKGLVITTGMLKLLSHDCHYSALLTHEFAHKFLRQTWPVGVYLTQDDESKSGMTAENWKQVRSNELEADFVASLTAFTTDCLAEVMDRSTPAFVNMITGFPDWSRKEMVKMMLLRQNSIDSIKEMKLDRIYPAGQLPTPFPSKTASDSDWIWYIKKTLIAMYPNQAVRVAVVEIIPSKIKGVIMADLSTASILVDFDLLRDVVRTREELAVLMGHEFGHILTSRNTRLDFQKAGVPKSDLELIDQRETEADIFGILPIRKGECYLATVLQRLSTSQFAKTYDETEQEHGRARIARLSAMCNNNY